MIPGPAAVMTIACAILTFIMVFIVPRFEQIFRELGVQLPGVTIALIFIGPIGFFARRIGN